MEVLVVKMLVNMEDTAVVFMVTVVALEATNLDSRTRAVGGTDSRSMMNMMKAPHLPQQHKTEIQLYQAQRPKSRAAEVEGTGDRYTGL